MRRRTLLETVEETEKELINVNELIHDTYIKSDGSEVPYNGWSSTPFIPVKVGRRYMVVNIQDNYNCMYDEQKNKIENLFLAGKTTKKYKIIFEPEVTGYVRFSGNDANIQQASFVELN